MGDRWFSKGAFVCGRWVGVEIDGNRGNIEWVSDWWMVVNTYTKCLYIIIMVVAVTSDPRFMASYYYLDGWSMSVYHRSEFRECGLTDVFSRLEHQGLAGPAGWPAAFRHTASHNVPLCPACSDWKLVLKGTVEIKNSEFCEPSESVLEAV